MNYISSGGGGGIKALRKEWSSLLAKSMCFRNSTMFSLCWQLSEGSAIQPMKCTAMYACLMEFNETNKPFDFCHRVSNSRTGSSLSFSVFGCCMHRAVHSPFETEQPWLSNSGSGPLASELTFSLIQLAFCPCLRLLLFHRQGEVMKPCFARMGKRRH